MAVADRIAHLQAEIASRQGRGGGAGLDALRARLAALQGLPEPAAGVATTPTFRPAAQTGVPSGQYRTANGQIIPIRAGLVSPAVYSAYRAANPQLDAARAQVARTQANLAYQAQVQRQLQQEQWGYLLTPENLAALGMNAATTADQLTPTQINALTRVAAGQQIAGTVAATDQAGQAAQAAGGRWGGPVPQAGGIGYENPVPAGWTPEMAAEVAQPAGAPPITPDVYAAQNPNMNPALLAQWRRIYEQALARLQNPGV